MRIDLMRDSSKVFPTIEAPEEVRQLRVWHCKYKSLEPIKALSNLEELVIATFPDDSFTLIAGLTNLRYLRILNMPKITNISPLEALHNLESLALETSASLHAKKAQIINSINPITSLKLLKHLELHSIAQADMSLKPIEKMGSLLTARFSGYPKEEIDRFYSETGIERKSNPDSSFH